MKAQFTLDFLNKEYLNFKIKFNIKISIIFIVLLTNQNLSLSKI